MRSRNPVFSRRGFTPGGGYANFNAAPPSGSATQGNPYANSPYAQPTDPYAGNPYGQPTNPYAQGAPDLQQGMPQAPARPGAMTMDDVVSRTAITLGLVIVAAGAAWALKLPVALGFGAGFVAMILGFVQAFKPKASPALILAYAALEGLFLGVISQAYNEVAQGAPMQAVLGTVAVFAGVLVAYRARIINVTNRFYRFVMGATIGFILLGLVNSLFAAFGGGDGLGLRTGTVGILVGIAGVLLGAAFLALDFKQVEDGIQYGAPRDEAWLAAFGLTLSLVWIYTELLRIIALVMSDD
ncbi:MULTISPECIES: Bax inhibitor-1/YccA family protein [Streptomyces]|uniref:Bax inhibitor-1/YccA family protein n=1 Tax=Streptomyces TaxID=1883 RepID=UPI00163BDE1D|nr:MULTISPECIES: Bax inhibitor-1/YccA family protein [Streptomyces]MBC2876148.1 Bax inhibitor-1/YccA family protein [Streptomyces sp. TYQ1024]UBI38504.1 Bax inhibitor-1/YccA family protein [Streptomyces mobaraensis]UKW31088.1 Bax inhibitor-1/YccA family protein [Streptomyces sp. TYQ1024]